MKLNIIELTDVNGILTYINFNNVLSFFRSQKGYTIITYNYDGELAEHVQETPSEIIYLLNNETL